MSDLLPEIREICRLCDIKPARSKGQNFLINERIYDDIVAAAEIKADDIILEVGPGLGFLTLKLAKQAKRVIAVELDDKLADYLQTGIAAKDIKNIEIVNEDILRFNLGHYLKSSEEYKIVANLPYNITSIFLRIFLSSPQPPQSLILMLQKEVAERIVATPPKMNLLALAVQYYAEAKIVREVKAGNFWPEPKVDSAVIKIEVKKHAPAHSQTLKNQLIKDKQFFRLAKIAFSAKRKMLKNNLASGLKIDQKIITELLIKNKFNPQLRAEDLSLEDWRKLFATFSEFMV